jgi:hypothetical protein
MLPLYVVSYYVIGVGNFSLHHEMIIYFFSNSVIPYYGRIFKSIIPLPDNVSC